MLRPGAEKSLYFSGSFFDPARPVFLGWCLSEHFWFIFLYPSTSLGTEFQASLLSLSPSFSASDMLSPGVLYLSPPSSYELYLVPLLNPGCPSAEFSGDP
jgi:hypothetical protein